jgi:RsiW-degrading membrane proteinase PrsW (M82 family)
METTKPPAEKSPAEKWIRVALVGGALLALPGLPLAFGFICFGIQAISSGDYAPFSGGLTAFIFALMSLGGGLTLVWHSAAALKGGESRPMRLWSPWVLLAIFGLTLIGARVAASDYLFGLFFPPLLALAAALPPLAALAWFAEGSWLISHSPFTQGRPNSLTWRWATLALVGGGTVGVVVAIVLETILPTIAFVLVFSLAEIVLSQAERLFEALAGGEVAAAITSPGFIYIFIVVAIIAPLAEELAKPLIALPLARRLSRRQAFLLGALAGVGFAAIENILYAGFGFSFWAGILLIRALGGAIHPLGAGLMALAWRDLLQGETGAGGNWLRCFGMAAGMHALWNGGSLLVITLASARFFGQLPPEVDLLGLSAAGTTLALLMVLGGVALWLGRSIYRRLGPTDSPLEAASRLIISDRAMAIWALAALAVIVPAGIAGLQLWL